MGYNISLSAGVAQQVEQLICNQPVGGSIPSASSNLPKARLVVDHQAMDSKGLRGDTQAAKGGRL